MRARRLHLSAATAAAALAALLPARDAQANGRFPQANYLVVGPGPRSDLIALRATFGLVVSRDHGARWDWVCEEALDAVGSFDPSLSIASTGAIAMGLPNGLQVSSRDLCRWAPAGATISSVTDTTQDASAQTIFATGTVFGGPSATTQVVRSVDGGSTWRSMAQLPEFIVETIDVAPGDPRRVYLSGYRPGAVARILRSDDGGATFRETAARFAELASVWIAAVDPTRPDRLWLRVAAGLGTELYRSDDGGASAARIAQTSEPMDGFAVSDDGETVWYGTANRALGIHRSTRGGPFVRVGASASVRCMRFHAGVLFVCADEALDGYSLGWSTDAGETLRPLMSLRDLRGPVAGCEGDAGATSVCASPWAQLAPQLRDLDASAAPPRVPLPAVDAGGAPDVPALDALSDAPAPDSDEAGAARDGGIDAAITDLPAIEDVADAGRDAAAPTELSRLDASLTDAQSPPDVRDAAALVDRAAIDAGARDGASGADAGPPSSGGRCACATVGVGRSRAQLLAVVLVAIARSRRRRRRARG